MAGSTDDHHMKAFSCMVYRKTTPTSHNVVTPASSSYSDMSPWPSEDMVDTDLKY